MRIPSSLTIKSNLCPFLRLKPSITGLGMTIKKLVPMDVIVTAYLTGIQFKVSSAAGVVFDGLARGLPFVATDLEFIREFSAQRLGITVRRNLVAFSKGLVALTSNYTGFRESVDIFKKKLIWNAVTI